MALESSASHYAQASNAASPWQRPFAPATCDVAVVGAGVIGASTAYALRQLRPTMRVALVDAGHLAGGASGRNAGFLIPGTHTDIVTAVEQFGGDYARRIFDFTLENVDLVSRLDGAAFNLQFSGSLIAAGSEEEARRLEQSASMLGEAAAEGTWLDAAEVAHQTGGGQFNGALHVAAGGTLDPAKFVLHLAARSESTVAEHWPVEALEPTGGCVRLRGPGGTIEAGRVVLCTNAFLPLLVPGAERWVRPVRAQMLATEPLARFLRTPVYSHEGYYYVRQLADGRVLAGGARHLHEAAEVGYDAVTTPAVQESIERYLAEHFPQVGAAAIERRWAGIMGFSPDGLPVAGALADLPEALFACGFTGHGMGYGLRFGFLLARMALGETDNASDLFAPSRFHVDA